MEVVLSIVQVCVQALITSSLCALPAIVYQKECEEAIPKTCWAINKGFSVPTRSYSVAEHRQLLTEG